MIKFFYKKLLKPILFKMDPEYVHDLFVSFGERVGNWKFGRWWISIMYRYKGLYKGKTVDGIHYKSPVSLAAGFDYNGRLAHVLDCMSFGGDEIGSVTARPCKGNEKPRLKRMVKSNALVVYKGLKNEGVEAVIKRLKSKKKPEGFVWGISIAKTNDEEAASTASGIQDYLYSLTRLNQEGVGDFYTINISCPNVHGGESFAQPKYLKPLFEELSKVNVKKPVYVKMPINEDWKDFNELLEVLNHFEMVKGVVIGNLNKNYEEADFPEEGPQKYRGGLSGKVCRERSTVLIRETKKQWGDRFTIIGCGGILSVEDAMEKLDAGADLLQLISGMIFEGPHLMKDICKAMEKREG
jgi:dihydroorotate dehydrogenase subfamily 2